MKKFIPSFIFSLCCLLSQAQITFLKTDMPEHKDTLVSRVFPTNWGLAGANRVYDFRMFHSTALDSIYYLTPTSAQNATVPNANLAVTSDHKTYLLGENTTSYFAFDGLQVEVNGNTIITNYSQIDTYYKFNTVYGQKFRGTYAGTTTVPGSTVGISAANQVRISNTTTYTDTIDGWGKVKTPVGTYDCLRQKRVEHSTTVIDYNLCGICPWTNYTTVTTTSTTYGYLAKETHGTVINFTYDSINEPLSASWSATPPYPIANFSYTTGTNGLANFTDSSTGAPLTYSWNFGDGTAVSTAVSPNHNFAANGTYYVCLTVTNVSGTNTKCDSVHITNINANTPPKAIMDSATVIQPGSVSIHVLANDVNYIPADTVCITFVFGPAAADATVSGCSQIIFHPSNATFTGLDTFFYISCDTHLPALCDTGMVVVDVLPAPVSPTADFTFTQNGCLGGTFVNHSLSADSLFWNFTAQPTGFDTTIVNASLISVPNGSSPFSGKNFSVCLTATNAYGRSVKCDTVSFICAGIDEISPADYRIYPNPASDMIQIDLFHIDQAMLKDISDIVIYNVLGEKIKILPIDSQSISVSELSNGVYIIGIVDKNKSKKILGKVEVLR
jgi:PKD repeat protein